MGAYGHVNFDAILIFSNGSVDGLMTMQMGKRYTIKLATSQHPEDPEIPEPLHDYQKKKYDQNPISASLLTVSRGTTLHSLGIPGCGGRPKCFINHIRTKGKQINYKEVAIR